MSPEWMQWLEKNMPAKMLEEFSSDWKHNATWRDKLIAKQSERIAELSEAWQKPADEADSIAESYDMLKGAWATDLAKLKKAEAELAQVMEWAGGNCRCCAYMEEQEETSVGIACGLPNKNMYYYCNGANWSPAWAAKGE